MPKNYKEWLKENHNSKNRELESKQSYDNLFKEICEEFSVKHPSQLTISDHEKFLKNLSDRWQTEKNRIFTKSYIKRTDSMTDEVMDD
jgi:hypothetical protein